MGPETGSPEIVCQSNTGGIITSGGGFSSYYAAPSYQTKTMQLYFQRTASTPPASGYNANGRGYPDISLIGVNYKVIIGGLLYTVYGTSCSSPAIAAYVTLVNSARVAEGKPLIGFINPTLYSVGYNNSVGLPSMYNGTFNDVTSGTNKCCSGSSNPVCCTQGFTAVAGW
jgi:tripeptidyl-peptidase-1